MLRSLVTVASAAAATPVTPNDAISIAASAYLFIIGSF
jgi:hypothetical protein